MVQGISPGISIRRNTLVVREEMNTEFATLFLSFLEEEEFFVLLQNINEAKQITYLQNNKQLFKAVKHFFANGGQRLYLLNFSFSEEFDYSLVYDFLQDHCDTLSDLETICTIGLVEGLLSESEITIDEALKVIYQINAYASLTDRMSISDINATIKDHFLDRLDETVIYYPWFIDEDRELVAPSVIASALASNLALDGKFFHSIANKEIYTLQNLSEKLSQSEVDDLHKEALNPIIDTHSQGLRIWGVKAFNSRYKSANEMRIIKYIKRSFKRITRPYLFEGNTEDLHDRLYTKIYHFLYLLWQEGILSGASQEEAFGLSTGTRSLDPERNSLVFEVSVAVSKPLEFIVITLNRIEKDGAQESLSMEV